jgi:hypothetical protein
MLDSHPYTSNCSGSRIATGMVVEATMASFASSGCNCISFRPLSAASVKPSTAKLKYGSTSSSTMSSRKTASGSNASFAKMTQSLNFWSLLMALLSIMRTLTLRAQSNQCCEAAHMTGVWALFLYDSATYRAELGQKALFRSRSGKNWATSIGRAPSINRLCKINDQSR